MTTRIAINGFGRIGRLVLRAFIENPHKNLDIVAINDLGSVKDNAFLLKHDSVHGTFPKEVTIQGNNLIVDGHKIFVTCEPNPGKLPWKDQNIDLVFECSGHFTDKNDAEKHLEAGAKKVLISAPSKDADITVVYGVNHHKITKSDKIISNASCTTNCLAPIAFVLNKVFDLQKGFMTTIHSYTGDQRLLDTLHKDPYRSRAAAISMIPTSTGAAKTLGLILPELQGKIDGTAVRVPTPNVSLVDFTFTVKKACTKDDINNALLKASLSEPLKNILTVNNDPLVSVDFNHNAASSVFDLNQTHVVDKNFCRVLAWYDNEWGFSNRMLDTALAISTSL